MRLIVTGVNSRGRSYVVANDPIPDTGPSVWTVDTRVTRAWADAIDPRSVPPDLEPSVGGTKVIVASGQRGIRTGPGFEEQGFHRTRTIDYVYVLEGDRFLDLDDDSVKVHPGDLVIQQATRHAWRYLEPGRFMAIVTRIGSD